MFNYPNFVSISKEKEPKKGLYKEIGKYAQEIMRITKRDVRSCVMVVPKLRKFKERYELFSPYYSDIYILCYIFKQKKEGGANRGVISNEIIYKLFLVFFTRWNGIC